MTAAIAGHNSDSMKTLHFLHFNKIEEKKRIVKAAQDELKRVRKDAKADGCVMADLDYMARCANLEDPGIVPAELARRAEIAAWFVLPVNYQPDMFEDRAPLDERAFKEGEKAAMTNGDPVPPYDANSPAGQEWMKGWHQGQKNMRDAMQADMEKRLSSKESDPFPGEDE